MSVDRERPEGLTFGIFPGMIGNEPGLSGGDPLYDPERTAEACSLLQAGKRPFLIRAYEIFQGGESRGSATPGELHRFVGPGRKIDYVLCYRSPDGNLEDWVAFVKAIFGEHGPQIEALQVTEEPNNPDPSTGGDGASPRVLEAIVEGVIAAREEAERLGLDVKIGFNACPSFNSADPFWNEIGARGGQTFRDALGYVGLDFFPDVFRPIPFETLPAAVEGVLTHFRTVNLAAGRLSESLPIRITENGWPTGTGRPPETQARVLEAIVRSIHGLRQGLNVTHYEFFSLRDGRSDNPEALTEFGLVGRDYSRKPAFDVYRGLVDELGI